MGLKSRCAPAVSVGALALVVALCGAGVAGAQSAPVALKVTAADHAAVGKVTRVHQRSMGVNRGAFGGRQAEAEPLSDGQLRALAAVHQAAAAASSAEGGVNSGPRYMGDLHYFGGPTLTSTQQHSIYLFPTTGCPSVAACWGNPDRFLRDLGRSNFIHVTDQYTGLTSKGRYGMGQSYRANIATPLAQPLTDDDMLAIVHAAALVSGQSGYGHMYNVHLPPGADECFSASFSHCYSPDNFDTWYFCAYHGSADFDDVGHVVYSVEPYQNVPGCAVDPGSPNGSLVDSTNSVLSHEVFEAITDPDGDGWWNWDSNAVFGQEIGDECSFLGDFGFAPALFTAGEKQYAAQPEYNNSNHACTVKP
jgi:hypothetical protein